MKAFCAAVAGLGAMALASPAWAQLQVTPSFSIMEAYSDNVGLQPSEVARSGWVTDLVPALRIEQKSARLQSFIDYRLHELFYSSLSGINRHENFLHGFARLETIEKFLFTEARADINQVATTPFGLVPTQGVPAAGTNHIELRSAQLSPYVKGLISDMATYELRATETAVRSSGNLLPNTEAREWLASFASPSAGRRVGWSLDAASLELRNDVVGRLDDTRLRAALIYSPSLETRAFLLEGRESTDFGGPVRQKNDMPGAGLDWSPDNRTKVSALVQRRFFGSGHNFLMAHRTPLTAWRLSSLRDAKVLPVQLSSSRLVTLRALLSDLLLSTVPDPDARSEAVRQRVERTGLSDYTPLNSEFLQVRPYKLRLEEASFAALGALNTVSLTVSRREQRVLGASLSGTGPLPEDDFVQQGFVAEGSHRLTPFTALTLSVAQLRTKALGIERRTSQEQYNLFLRSRLGVRSLGTLGIRHINFESSFAGESFRENEIYLAFGVEL